MASQQVELFDLPSRDPNTCWSLNPWFAPPSPDPTASLCILPAALLTSGRKTRLILNYKKIPYKTVWVEYPDLAPKLKNLGLPPNQDGPAAYTSPAIILPDGTPLMDSRKIAAELEKVHPSPSLHLDSAVLPEVEDTILKSIMNPLRGLWQPKIPRNLLNEPSAEYFERTRAERFGCTLSELEKKTPEDGAWKEAEPGIKQMGDLLRKQGGPFFLGEYVSYADFIVVGALHFLKRIEARLYERFISIEPAFGKLYEACEVWLARDSH